MFTSPLDESSHEERPTVPWGAPAVQVDLVRIGELSGTPTLAVLDTSCVRTGLDYQLKNGIPPASVRTAQDGLIRLFMEKDTLYETWDRLPRFADQLGVPTTRLAQMLDAEWLPYISVVALPDAFRQLDDRAKAVRDLDPDDYPAAALAALLSPCILLTRNYRDFGPLGIRDMSQGVKGVVAAIDVRVGEGRMQTALAVPAAPVFLVGSGAKWAADRVGPVVWALLIVMAAGVYLLYRRQPEARKAGIKRVAGEVGQAVLQEIGAASRAAHQARRELGTYVVPPSGVRSRTSAILRELAMAPSSQSAQELSEVLDLDVRPTVASLRAFLHANKPGIFAEARRGSFILGSAYSLNSNASL